ncbi:uncharacterized protein [Onthophagus taurus]|uniref:uncharacterized protein n=1 Tax=Onthophagus taurus TaxID=166361 RepID=UPI000C204C03|nr:uncharacterized protein LOC111422640 [Onthophagus taurus]
MMAHSSQQGYAPLSQSISDSDSEKEIQMDSMRSLKPMNGMHKKLISNGFTLPNHTVHNLKSKPPMSFARKLSFVVSILACFVTVVVFLWVPPCTGTCPKRIAYWDNKWRNLEYTGKINIVPSAFPFINNLVLLFRRNVIKSNDTYTTDGVISLMGDSGKVAWLIPQNSTPKDLNCYLIDVNNDTVMDCLLIGESGIELINPISGEIFYRVKNLEKKSLSGIDVPIAITDLNKDGIKEMITVVNGKNYHNKFILISGRTGFILTKIIFKHCINLNCIKFDQNLITFSCTNSTEIEYFQLTLKNIEERYHNKSYEVTPIKISYSPVKENEYNLKNFKLIVNNVGICPECHTNLTLYNDKNTSVWMLSQSNSFVMKPTTFSFQSTKSNLISLRGHLNGFIIKYWQYTLVQEKKYLKDTPNLLQTDQSPMNLINEGVVLITFNETDVHVINASLTQIAQMCFLVNNSEDVCQPALESQENSLAVNDLDQDGSLELITYDTKYVDVDGNWKLFSEMKVIRLETELPKLYNAPK